MNDAIAKILKLVAPVLIDLVISSITDDNKKPKRKGGKK